MPFGFLRDGVERASDAVSSGASDLERFVARLVRGHKLTGAGRNEPYEDDMSTLIGGKTS